MWVFLKTVDSMDFYIFGYLLFFVNYPLNKEVFKVGGFMTMDCIFNCKEFREPLAEICCNNSSGTPQRSKPSHLDSIPYSDTYSEQLCPQDPPAEPFLSLLNADWYWGNISRQEANNILLGTPDGSFLLRDSQNSIGDFTLTLRKGGRNKLIKITCKSNKYGFSEPFEFRTVCDLINYYQHVPLSQFNPNLTIRLLYPISRCMKKDNFYHKEDLNKIKQQLIHYNKLYLNKSRVYNEYSEKSNALLIEISRGKSILNAYKKTLELFKEQMDFHADRLSIVEPHEIKAYQANFDILKERNTNLNESTIQLLNKLTKKEHFHNMLQNGMHNLELDILELMKNIEILEGLLISHGENIQEIKLLMSGKVVLDEQIVNLPHYNKSTWFTEDCSRSQAEEILYGAKDGTFLVRPSKTGQYALSVVCNRTTNHCIIIKTDRGYGFAEPFNVHKTLKDLVLHYYNNSLEEHNDSMHVTLAFPAFVNRTTVDASETIDI